MQAFLSPPIQGVIIQSYGAGNLPSKRNDLLDIFREAVSNQIVIVNVTQCSKGTISISYETGKVSWSGSIIPKIMTITLKFKNWVFYQEMRQFQHVTTLLNRQENIVGYLNFHFFKNLKVIFQLLSGTINDLYIVIGTSTVTFYPLR